MASRPTKWSVTCSQIFSPRWTALAKLPADEAAQVGAWLVDIAKTVAAAAKGIKPEEQAAIDKIAALFAVTS